MPAARRFDWSTGIVVATLVAAYGVIDLGYAPAKAVALLQRGVARGLGVLSAGE